MYPRRQGYYARPYRRQYTTRPKKRYNKTKQLVTGRGPTVLEQISNGVGKVAQLAGAVAPIVAAINTELKYYDAIGSANPVFGTHTFIPLLVPSNGTGDSQRIGNSILTKDIQVRIKLTPVNFDTQPYHEFRCMLFIDKFGNGGAPTAAQLLERDDVWLSPINRDYSDRFVVLKDWFQTISQNAGDPYSVVMKTFKKLDFHTRYVGNGSTLVDLGPNQPYLMLWSNDTNIGESNIQYYARTNFTDN